MPLYVSPTPQSKHGGLLGLRQGYHHLPATPQSMGKGNIQQHLTSLDTMSTLVSDTLVVRPGATELLTSVEYSRI